MIVFCTYSYFGNKITMSKIIICDEMIRKFNGKIGHIIHRYNNWDNLSLSLQKVHTFYTAFEMQKGVVVKSSDPKSEIAVKIKGHFSRGINQNNEEEKEDEKKKGCCPKMKERFTNMKEWISNKISLKKVDKDKKDEDSDEKSKSENVADDKKSEEKKEENKEEKKEEEKKKNQSFDEILTLKDIDLEFKKGEFVCIIGEVGSGKTTLLLSMLGELLYVPQSEIDIAGGSLERELTKEECKALTH